jgi:PAS domain-containing protein
MDQRHASALPFDALIAELAGFAQDVLAPTGPVPALERLAGRLRELFAADGVAVAVFGLGVGGQDDRILVTSGVATATAETAIRRVERGSDPSSPMWLGCEELTSAGETPPCTGGIWVVPITAASGVGGAVLLAFSGQMTPVDPVLQTASSAARILGAALRLRREAAQPSGTEQRLLDLLDGMPDPAIILDGGGRLVAASEKALGLFGAPREEVVGAGFDQVVRAGEPSGLGQALAARTGVGPVDLSVRAVNGAAGERHLQLKAKEIGKDRWLAVLHDHSRFAARDRSRRIMLDHIPRIAAATSAQELWVRLWAAVQAMLPASDAMRVYRGEAAVVRLLWASDADAPSIGFTLRGWGLQIFDLIEEIGRNEEMVLRFGATREEGLGRLRRYLAGQGNPMLLDDPDAQLEPFLGSEGVRLVRESRKGPPPGQEILCPILSEQRLDLIAAVLGPPEAHPFGWDDAADVWQLVHLAREVLGRLESRVTIERHLGEVQSVRNLMQEVSLAAAGEEVYEVIANGAREALGAQGAAVLVIDPEHGGGLRAEWHAGLGERSLEGVLTAAVRLFDVSKASVDGLLAFESIGAAEVLDEAEVDLEGIEAMTIAPLVNRARVLGALVLTWPSPRQLRVDERALNEFHAGELALAMANSRLYRRVADSQAEMRGIVESVDEGVVSLDAAGRIRYLSPRAAKVLSVRRADPRGRPFLDVVGLACRPGLARILDDVLRGREVDTGPMSLGERLARVRVALTRRHDASPAGSVWTISDITDEETRRLELEAIFAHTSDAVLVLSPEGEVLEANRAGERLIASITGPSGPANGAVTAAGWWPELDLEKLGSLPSGGRMSVTGRLSLADGTALPYESELSVVGGGEGARVVAVITDASDRRRFAEAENASRAKAEQLTAVRGLAAAAGTALEAQQDAVTAMLLHVQLAAESEDPERWREALGVVGDAAMRARGGLAEGAQQMVRMEEILDADQGPVGSGGGEGWRGVWLVSDRPQTGGAVRRDFERLGWQVSVVPEGDLTSDVPPADPPSLVVVELTSVTSTQDAYRRVRRMAPQIPVVLVVPAGSAAAVPTLSEEHGLHVVQSLPAGAELDELLARVTGGE